MYLLCYGTVIVLAMFTSEMRERAAGTVELRGVSSTALEKVLEFIYSGDIILSLDNIQDILAAASHLQVMHVLDFCKVNTYCFNIILMLLILLLLIFVIKQYVFGVWWAVAPLSPIELPLVVFGPFLWLGFIFVPVDTGASRGRPLLQLLIQAT